ncbi:NAD(P)/FAD-dependent oxidoreductase [Algoriphagus sp. C2-6-M1]|uniref:protoporphyrinogen/coproporphyrinogen oxidase n=1 Tax=Algoriphagus persicinus TaxID=3108754 RepID=UPI002B3D4EFF|nr:NAD(P)/FAD-dependent oxidoreductase [Algoriphagus sp. C2-6-M1]MEB2779125.1 NAD(P)/FAD-dependent oxidoreductase [Algoriphagus sp. C2-6-M1]
MKDQNIYIIGAGVAGLVAALELEKSGFSPVILESSNGIGGRIKTDEVDGFLMDHGFQVLLTAYPEVKKYLDLGALNLKYLEPGAVIFGAKDTFIIADPLRNPLKVVSMAFSHVGSFLDKVKMFNLTQMLRNKSIEDIFNEPSIPTHMYLNEYGFSDRIISNFFKPFFRGIFLEKDLNTSSRMFEFVFKMFSQGMGAIPEKGMIEVPNMLRGKLRKTLFLFNTRVAEVQGKEIVLDNGETLQADRIIIATQPDKFMKQLQGQFAPSRSVITLYFSLHKSFMSRAMLGLIPGENHLINNLVFMTDVSSAYSQNGRALLCVSILDTDLKEKELIKTVQSELESISRINAEYFKFVKSYYISYAIPTVEDVKNSIPFTECKIADHVFLAGDYLLNGSINAAMTSGRTAAEAVVHSYQPMY